MPVRRPSELHVGLDWIGFGCVLTAIPILATADSLARVFEQRTGGLVRPLPWSILTPVFAGLILCSAGMALSGTGLMRDEPPAAFLATALASSGLMLLLARRTGKEAFVWAMLIGLTIAYNTSPRFFAEAVNALKAHGATAVRENTLPIAFYGLDVPAAPGRRCSSPVSLPTDREASFSPDRCGSTASA